MGISASAAPYKRQHPQERSVTREYSTPEFSYTTQATTLRADLWETSVEEGPEVPLAIFAGVPAMQALARYLVDERNHSVSEAARLLGRAPKSLWASYHQRGPLPAHDDEGLRVPLSVFSTGGAPLESLVAHLHARGLRNIEIARLLKRSPKTIHTLRKRREVRT